MEEQPRLHAFVCAGIGAQNFSHTVDNSERGHVSRRIVEKFISIGSNTIVGPFEEGRISLFEAIKNQFGKNGTLPSVPAGQVFHDNVDTFADKDDNGHLWWSHRRGDSQRNGILVIRR